MHTNHNIKLSLHSIQFFKWTKTRPATNHQRKNRANRKWEASILRLDNMPVKKSMTTLTTRCNYIRTSWSQKWTGWTETKNFKSTASKKLARLPFLEKLSKLTRARKRRNHYIREMRKNRVLNRPPHNMLLHQPSLLSNKLDRINLRSMRLSLKIPRSLKAKVKCSSRRKTQRIVLTTRTTSWLDWLPHICFIIIDFHFSFF